MDFWWQWSKWDVSAVGSYVRKDIEVWCLFNTPFSFSSEQAPGWKCTLNSFSVEKQAEKLFLHKKPIENYSGLKKRVTWLGLHVKLPDNVYDTRQQKLNMGGETTRIYLEESCDGDEFWTYLILCAPRVSKYWVESYEISEIQQILT